MSLYFIEDENEEEFTREVLTIINILEALGGFFEIILVSSSLLIGPVNSFLFQSELISKLYLEQKETEKVRKNDNFVKLQENKE